MEAAKIRCRSELYADDDGPQVGGRVLAYQKRKKHDLYFDADVLDERVGKNGTKEWKIQ